MAIHLAGKEFNYKKIKKTDAKCLVCSIVSPCQIYKIEERIHFLLINIKVLEERFWFDWAQCNHRVELYEKRDVERYKAEQVETGILSVPYYQNMSIRMLERPKKLTRKGMVLYIAGMLIILILGILLYLLLDRLGIPLVF